MKRVFLNIFIFSHLMVFSGQEKPELSNSAKKTSNKEKKETKLNEINTPQLLISDKKYNIQNNQNNAVPKPAVMEKKPND
jgi:hypothetical protein